MKNRPLMLLSRTVQNLPEAMSIYINQIVNDLQRNGQDVITLSLGEAFFDLPLFDFNKLDMRKCYHYSDSQGIPELRTKIADYYNARYGTRVDAKKELLISAGSKPILYMAMLAAVNPGEEILFHEPAWLSYQEQARLVGAVPKFIPYDVATRDFESHLTPKTRMLVINNPNNPAGRLYDRSDLEAIYEMCRARGIYVLVDEAYSDFIVDRKFSSMAEVVKDLDGVIVINSLSKNMGISGWRIGYAIAHPDFLDCLLKINQHLLTCGSTILLYYCAHYFDRIVSITLPQVLDVVRKRRRVAGTMQEMGLESMGGECTFYFFVSLGSFPGSSFDFSMQLLLDHGVAVVPGSAYGRSTERFIRVGIGTESEERIDQALVYIKQLTERRDFDPSALQSRLDVLRVRGICGI